MLEFLLVRAPVMGSRGHPNAHAYVAASVKTSDTEVLETRLDIRMWGHKLIHSRSSNNQPVAFLPSVVHRVQSMGPSSGWSPGISRLVESRRAEFLLAWKPWSKPVSGGDTAPCCLPALCLLRSASCQYGNTYVSHFTRDTRTLPLS